MYVLWRHVVIYMDCIVGRLQGHLSPRNHLMIIIDSGNILMIGGLVLLKYIGNGDKFRKSVQE